MILDESIVFLPRLRKTEANIAATPLGLNHFTAVQNNRFSIVDAL
jgi:hypothetical protein